MTKILLVDDHPIVRDGLKRLLNEKLPRPVFGEASDSQEALDMALGERWDAVVLDISLPDRNGLDVLKILHKKRPGMPVIILSMHPEDQFAVRTIKAGAAGYIKKESAPDVLVDALKSVISGRKFITPSVAEHLADQMTSNTKTSSHEDLSDREDEVLRLMASGQTAAQIARRLSLSVKTISTYRTRILNKLKLTSTAQIIRYAIKNNLA